MSRQSNWGETHYEELVNVTRRLQSYVSIYVANENTPYIIEREVLETQSSYFRQLLQSGHVPLFRFPDDQLNTWRVLLYWLEEESLPLVLVEPLLDNTYQMVIECYALGEKYGFSAFQDRIMGYVLDEINEWPGVDIEPWWCQRDVVADAISHTFRSTQPCTKLREVFVEEAVLFYFWDDEDPFGVPFSQQQLIDFDGSGFFQLFAKKQAEMGRGIPPEAQRNDVQEDGEDESEEDEGRRFDELHLSMSRFDRDRNPLRFWTNYMVNPKEQYKQRGEYMD
ncbi:hypothetical protein M409DRAFT_24904 [Zasmidium cellare ATCC 36951]|uniref:BTB domain-containing protein n=1 Tax=Zasmidium cellare ATCC 36951 TaxID=1080233 RepID=A0A6A6CE83_ZASCE|nr:uncharacterized protein M409DRAFT_24904 [Zasmidium cellare ATCC 36951]KAF2165003.1 hypothetical protein M409DRAFT_24904 [Zasmidium cellare ATCC 36951]